MSTVTYTKDGVTFTRPNVQDLNQSPNYRPGGSETTTTKHKEVTQVVVLDYSHPTDTTATITATTYPIAYTYTGAPDAWNHNDEQIQVFPMILAILILLFVGYRLAKWIASPKGRITGYAHKHRHANGLFHNRPGEPLPRAFGRPGGHHK